MNRSRGAYFTTCKFHDTIQWAYVYILRECLVIKCLILCACCESLQRKELAGLEDRELEKQLDLEGYSYDEEEPEEVKSARAELKVRNANHL